MTSPTAVTTQTASLSDVGRTRSANQDRCGEFEDADGYRLLIVADGMGGHQGGEVASQVAVDTVREVFRNGVGDPADLLGNAIRAANDRIHTMAARDTELAGMGTTGAALLIGPGRRAWLAHVGDSRVYRLRDGRLDVLTMDHSWVLDEVRQNRLTLEEAATHPRKNVLTRSIGVDPSVEVELAETTLEPGDRYLLCSDGLWGEVAADEIAHVVGHEPPERAVQTLVELANQAGGPDNITVQVAALPAELPAEPTRRGGRMTAIALAVAVALTLFWLAARG